MFSRFKQIPNQLGKIMENQARIGYSVVGWKDVSSGCLLRVPVKGIVVSWGLHRF